MSQVPALDMNAVQEESRELTRRPSFTKKMSSKFKVRAGTGVPLRQRPTRTPPGPRKAPQQTLATYGGACCAQGASHVMRSSGVVGH